MNWLDIILIIVMAIVLVGGIVLLAIGIAEKEVGTGFAMLGLAIFICGLISLPFWVIDKKAGQTVGTITSVDKNFFGTTAVYIKINESKEEKYCVEADNLEDLANKYIGKQVSVKYGKRIGLFSTGKCGEAPLESIKLVEN